MFKEYRINSMIVLEYTKRDRSDKKVVVRDIVTHREYHGDKKQSSRKVKKL